MTNDTVVFAVAGAIAVALVILIAWMEVRIRAHEAEEAARANQRQAVLSRSFRRGGAK